ncbi:ABC transporter ATP-binding protein [Zavarzinia sp. CC-PAN008]|uniref:ABC transporter ATP-binding protein n=1 Tax=Zavarzinia sp. CC-PAN008 TaxID=3243332 RepID=UPI003F745D1A
MPALELGQVGHRYGAFEAVAGVDLAVGPGEVMCLLGPSGCGKTTVLRLVAGLERLQAGRIAIGDETVAGRGVHVAPEARQIGLIFQDYALFPHLSVAANVAFGLGGEAAARRRTALAALERVGLQHLADSFPHMLSGGEQQRVALVRALAPGPRVMLMDEPFSGLDVRLRDRVRDETLALLSGAGVATLLVTHDPEEAMRMADRIAIMRQGRIVQQGPPAELYDHPVDAGVARFFSEVTELAGIVQGGRVMTPFGSVPASLAEGTVVQVLVRPHGVRLAGPGSGDAAMPASVHAVRILGSEVLATLESPVGTRIVARLPRHLAPSPGEAVTLELDPAEAHVFAIDAAPAQVDAVARRVHPAA